MHRLQRLRFSLCALALATACAGADEPEVNAASEAEAPVAENPAPVIERPPQPTRSTSMASDLASRLPPAEVLELTTETESFLTLWQPANVATPRGLIVILPGEGESADWPSGIAPLRRNLPDHGWHTLSVSLPDASYVMPRLPTEAQPVEPENADAPEETIEPVPPEEAGYLPEETAAAPEEDAGEPPTIADDADTEADAEDDVEEKAEGEVEEVELPERIDQRISAALEHGRSLQVDTVILLGQGSGAYWAARHLQQQAPAEVTRLAMVQPRQPDGQQPLTELLPALRLPVGDFYYRENNRARNEARERLNISRRIDHPHYHQIGLTELVGEHGVKQEQLVRRIRGWLDRSLDQKSR